MRSRSEAKEVKALYVEDGRLFFESIEKLFAKEGIELWPRPTSFADVDSRLEAGEVDILIVDLHLNLGSDGKKEISNVEQTVHKITKWREEYPKLSIVAYSHAISLRPHFVNTFFNNKVSYLIKDEIDSEELVTLIRFLKRGGLIFSPGPTSAISFEGKNYGHELTERQWQVSSLTAAGKKDGEIAHILGVKPGTVAEKLSEVRNKLNLESKTAVAVWFTDQLHKGEVPNRYKELHDQHKKN